MLSSKPKGPDAIIPGCANHYTKGTIYDLFMESEEDANRCNGCANLQYVAGTMTCRELTKIREDER